LTHLNVISVVYGAQVTAATIKNVQKFNFDII
jgi:hypothetical protein